MCHRYSYSTPSAPRHLHPGLIPFVYPHSSSINGPPIPYAIGGQLADVIIRNSCFSPLSYLSFVRGVCRKTGSGYIIAYSGYRSCPTARRLMALKRVTGSAYKTAHKAGYKADLPCKDSRHRQAMMSISEHPSASLESGMRSDVPVWPCSVTGS